MHHSFFLNNFFFRFLQKWDFPNCLGAVDGKHIAMKAPNNSGTTYFNYKKTFSINLMAIADASYKFITVDIGQMGSSSDGGVWDHSNFGSAWNRDRINVPPPTPLPLTDTEIKYVIVGDEAFPLKPNLMRPFPGRDLTGEMRKRRFNYRLSRARRVVENAFGILANRWRFLFSPVDADPEKLTTMVHAACVLHNLLLTLSDSEYVPPGLGDTILPDGDIADGIWRMDDQLQNIRQQPGRNHAVAATATREQLVEWCSGVGAREWQDRLLRRTTS